MAILPHDVQIDTGGKCQFWSQ